MDSRYRRIWAILLISCVALAILFADGRIDHDFTLLFYDAQSKTFPARESEFVDLVLYRGMKIFMSGVFVAYVIWGIRALKSARPGFNLRHLLVGIIGTGLIIGMVNFLKSITGIECPWSTEPFGGKASLLALGDTFTSLLSGSRGNGRCFPAGHSTGGLFLFAWAIALRDSAPNAAKITTWLGLTVGLFMGLTRIAQGAHFLSHVFWAVWVAALIAVVLNIWLDSSKSRTLI